MPIRWAGVLTAGVVALGFAGSAAAEQERGSQATIEIKRQGGLDFDGPTAIASGAQLTIVNRTNPQNVGPHTFTLVKKGKKPHRRVANAHEVDQQGNVGQPIVETGQVGWNRVFTFRSDGDSWFTDEQGEQHTREVSAAIGRTIRYYCAIHPFMRGKFEVTPN